MRTFMDARGRVTIPAEVRRQLGIRPGQPFDIAIVDGWISLEAPSVDMRLQVRGGVPSAVVTEPVDELTTETVRNTLEDLRR